MNEKTINKYLTEKTELTKTELNCLQQLHLQGFWKAGSLNKKKRLEVLKGLIKKGYLDDEARLTKKGIEASKPKF